MPLEPPPEEVNEGAPVWMTTFADLMSLLLTFFVLLLSFSTMEVDKFNAATGSIRNAFGMKSEINILNFVSSSKIKAVRTPAEKESPRTESKLTIVKLRQALEKSGMTEHARIESDGETVTLKVDGDLLFESGKARLSAEAQVLLDEIAQVAQSSTDEIEVQGHTDDVPIASSIFPSNWELSTSRAGSAVRYLSSKGVPAARLRAAGFADTRPVAPNDGAESRSKNRRVEFVFVSKNKRR